jgi:sec-independent protein translocase protein TatC
MAEKPAGERTTADFIGGVLDRLGIPRSVLSHLRELRSRMLRVLFTVGFFYTLFFIFEFRQVGDLGGIPIFAPVFSPFHPFAAQVLSKMRFDLIPPDVQVIQVSPTEIVILYMQIALGLAIACSMPMILYQFGRFVMPALYAHERRELLRLIVPGVLLFATGCAFAYRVVVPPIMMFLFEYTRELSPVVAVSVSLGQALEFAMLLVVAFGFVFEMPLVMTLLTRIGLVQARTWRRYSRHAAVLFLVVGGFITPDTSGVTQIMVALPMMGLYFSGCVFAEVSSRRKAARAAPATG